MQMRPTIRRIVSELTRWRLTFSGQTANKNCCGVDLVGLNVMSVQSTVPICIREGNRNKCHRFCSTENHESPFRTSCGGMISVNDLVKRQAGTDVKLHTDIFPRMEAT